MENNFFKKTVNFIKTEKRLCLAATFVALAFFVNWTLYSTQKITSTSCVGGKCIPASAEKPQLSKGNGFFYVDDILKNSPSGYYRLAFMAKSDKSEKIIIKLNTYSEKESQIGEMTLDPSIDFQNQEVAFFLPGGFSNLLFLKEDASGPANIFIKNVGISQLNIKSPGEISTLKKTVIGETKTDSIDESQNDTSADFPWLKDPKTAIGQIFRAKSDHYISSVTLAMDVIQSANPSSRQYVLNLKEVSYDGEKISSAGPTIASALFSASSAVEKYRQADGNFNFPLFGALQKGKYYMITLDNSRVDVSDQNYLDLKGSKSENSYPDGSAMTKRSGTLIKIDGDMFFQIHGVDAHMENGVAILNGAKIEDLGGGVGKYSYKTNGDYSDLFDLSDFSLGTNFNSNSDVISAPAQGDSSFGYKVNTLYPINRMNFSAQQARADWKMAKISYSFDQNKWTDIPSSQISENISSQNIGTTDSSITGDTTTDNTTTNGSSSTDNSDNNSSADNSAGSINSSGSSGSPISENLQSFNFNIVPTVPVSTVYFKITYDPNDQRADATSFGIKDLNVTADLNTK